MKAAKRSRQKPSDGTRTSAWGLKPHQMQSKAPTSVCPFSSPPRTATHSVPRQEMSFYRQHLDSWANSDGESRLDKNDTDNHHPPGLPPLHPQVQCVEASSGLVWCSDIAPQTVTRRDTRTWLHMCHLHSVWRLVIRSLLVSRHWRDRAWTEGHQDNVDRCRRRCDSTCCGWRRTRRRPRRLASSERGWILLYRNA